MPAMTTSEADSFLNEVRHAIVATNREDGPPQLSPVWYLYENGLIYISLLTQTAKYRNLLRDPRISLCVDAGHPDARAVMISGTTEFFPKGHPLEEKIRAAIIRRYHDTQDDADAYAVRAAEWDFVLAIVTPEKLISQDYN